MNRVAMIIGGLIGVSSAAAGDMFSEEIRTRLDGVPRTLVRLAARRAGAGIAAELLEEWQGELYEILRGADAKPVTRLWKGLRYSVGLVVAAGEVGRTLRRRAETIDLPRHLAVIRAWFQPTRNSGFQLLLGSRVPTWTYRLGQRVEGPVLHSPKLRREGRSADTAHMIGVWFEAGSPPEGVECQLVVDVSRGNLVVAMLHEIPAGFGPLLWGAWADE